VLAGVVALAGCGSAGPPVATPSVPKTEPHSASAGPLVVERQWLQAWFRGTPVQIAQRGDGAVSVEVPRAFCFEPGRSELKPALAAVLDKVAESLRRLPQARVPLLAAPDDAGGPAGLALERAGRVQRHLQAHGVAAARLGKPVATVAAAVQLRLETPTPAP
jgi:outer membrane protein OmpA-like peptidoglycan-associated protein